MYSMGGVYKVKLYSWLHPKSFDNKMTVSVILILYPLPLLVSHCRYAFSQVQPINEYDLEYV